MRITIHIDDNLHAELKNIAARTGRTLTAVIHDALRDSLSRRRNAKRPPVNLRVFHGTGVMPGVDLNDSVALLDHMDDDLGRPPTV
ncbi:MAG: CopG family transcriptional regulator [Gemmatimonadetes bacterium]|nr:CopG family transcriptional regulator [Gemmatimonadota bacterium]MYG85958.1 CopG family transcriptional regulator [Gemmatimonadota bacterium]MYJ89644.1 CopG family transcriptional regulator [Gemmatimonadota bacterium]